MLSDKELKQQKELADAKLKEDEKKAAELKAKQEADAKALTEKAKKLEEEVKKLEKEQKDRKFTSPDGVTGLAFIKAYGDDGGVWFAEGKTFAEAGVCHTKKLTERVETLEKRLKAAAAGDPDPAEFEDDDAKDARVKKVVDKLTTKIGPRLAEFAARIHLPGK